MSEVGSDETVPRLVKQEYQTVCNRLLSKVLLGELWRSGWDVEEGGRKIRKDFLKVVSWQTGFGEGRGRPVFQVGK